MADLFEPVAAPWSEIFYAPGGVKKARLMHAGPEVHFEIHPDHRHRVIRRNVTREFLRPLYEQHGYLTTRVPLRGAAERKFVQRLGFDLTWSDLDYDYFMLTALPFAKKEK